MFSSYLRSLPLFFLCICGIGGHHNNIPSALVQDFLPHVIIFFSLYTCLRILFNNLYQLSLFLRLLFSHNSIFLFYASVCVIRVRFTHSNGMIEIALINQITFGTLKWNKLYTRYLNCMDWLVTCVLRIGYTFNNYLFFNDYNDL